jgi:hypothetical protein
MATPRRRKKVTELMRKLSVVDGDILLIKSGTGLANKEIIDQFTQSLARMGYYKTLVIVVDSLDDLQVLNEAGMNSHGWFRKTEAKT